MKASDFGVRVEPVSRAREPLADNTKLAKGRARHFVYHFLGAALYAASSHNHTQCSPWLVTQASSAREPLPAANCAASVLRLRSSRPRNLSRNVSSRASGTVGSSQLGREHTHSVPIRVQHIRRVGTWISSHRLLLHGIKGSVGTRDGRGFGWRVVGTKSQNFWTLDTRPLPTALHGHPPLLPRYSVAVKIKDASRAWWILCGCSWRPHCGQRTTRTQGAARVPTAPPPYTAQEMPFHAMPTSSANDSGCAGFFLFIRGTPNMLTFVLSDHSFQLCRHRRPRHLLHPRLPRGRPHLLLAPRHLPARSPRTTRRGPRRIRRLFPRAPKRKLAQRDAWAGQELGGSWTRGAWVLCRR